MKMKMKKKTAKKTNSKSMTYWEHIYELRNRILVAVASILIFSIIGYYIFPDIIKIILDVIKEKLYVTTITEGFLVRIKISIIFGIILSIPIFFYEIIAFIFPALRN